MVPSFEILLDCNNKVPKLKKEDTTWVPTEWADHMDPDAMTMLFGDHIYNIEEEEYWEACKHTLKSLYELRANDGDKEGGTAPNDREDENADLFCEEYGSDVDYYDQDIEDDVKANR